MTYMILICDGVTHCWVTRTTFESPRFGGSFVAERYADSLRDCSRSTPCNCALETRAQNKALAVTTAAEVEAERAASE